MVIPCEVGGNLRHVKIRRFDTKGQAIAQAGEKYSAPRGERGALFGADHLVGRGRPLLLCEGERDALLAMQELSHLVDVATLGGTSRRNLGHWALWMLPCRLILAVYDANAAGQESAAWCNTQSSGPSMCVGRSASIVACARVSNFLQRLKRGRCPLSVSAIPGRPWA